MFEERMETLGRRIGNREKPHRESMNGLETRVSALRAEVARGVDAFNAAVAEEGAPHLTIEVSSVRLDDKRIRAYEFEICRGRHRGVVVGKARGELVLVGPFRQGKSEGPCRSFPFDKEDEFAEALGEFLEAFIDEALTA